MIETARIYIARGWRVVPVPHRSKAPRVRGWQTLRLDETDLPTHFNGAPQNIGVLVGEPSGWLIDVDLDHPFAVEMAGRFLPSTGSIFGRPGNPGSHRLYRVTAPVETHKRQAPDGRMIVELRSTGGQTVFPPSVHPSGESIEWELDGDPETVDPEALREAVDALADAVLDRLGCKPKRCGASPPTLPQSADRDREMAVEALRHLSPSRADAYEGAGGWINVGMALHAVCGSLLAEWIAWSAKSDKFREGECEAKWTGFDGSGGLGLGSLVHWARQDTGWIPPRRTTHGDSDRSPKNAGKRDHVSLSPAVEPWKSFPIETFPEPVRGFIVASSKAIGCDPSYIALPMLACLGRAVGNRRTICLKRGWEEPAVFWATMIGKSGTHKTPALNTATDELRKLQSAAVAEHADTLRQYEQDMQLYERNYSEWKRKKTDDPPPWKPEEPVCPRYVTTDCTIEALAFLLSQQDNGLLVVRDELAGWLGGIAEYKGGKGSDLGHWLAAWSAQPLTVDRKTGATKMIHVPRAAVSLVGGIQPAVLRSAIGREHMQDGLCARLLLAYPPSRPVRWSEAIVDPAVEDAMRRLYGVLLSIEPAADEQGKPMPFPVPLSAEAKQQWIAYYNRHRAEIPTLDDDLAAAWSKLEAYAARFALVFHLVRAQSGSAPEGEIDAASMEAGTTLSDWFGHEARRVYGLLAESDEERERRELIETVERIGASTGGGITVRDLMRGCARYRGDAELAEMALQSLVEAGRGTWAMIDTRGRQRREFRPAGRDSMGDRE